MKVVLDNIDNLIAKDTIYSFFDYLKNKISITDVEIIKQILLVMYLIEICSKKDSPVKDK